MKKIARHSDAFLRAISQSFFFDDAFFGAGVLLLLLIFKPVYFECGVFAALFGYGYSTRYTTPKALRSTGLLVVNSFFFGIAMAAFFQSSPLLWFFLVSGAVALPWLTKAAFEVFQHWKLSPFVAPYILTVWIVWLCTQGGANSVGIWPADFYLPVRHLVPLLDPVFLSMGRLLFLPDAVFGLCLFALVTAFSPRRGFFFLSGTLIALGAAFLLSEGTNVWEQGILSYSAGLIGLGLASFPEKFNWRTIFVFSLLSAFGTLASAHFLRRLNLPVLSFPYLMTLWLALLSRSPKLNLNWSDSKALQWQEPRAVGMATATTEKILTEKAA